MGGWVDGWMDECVYVSIEMCVIMHMHRDM